MLIYVFIFQGWTKFYEFGMSDLRAGAVIIDRLCARAGKCFQNYFPTKKMLLELINCLGKDNESPIVN